MKLSFPDMDSPHLRNDAPMLKMFAVAVVLLLFFSNVTVFLGVRSYMADYVGHYSPLIKFGFYLVGFVLGAFTPDYINAAIAAWFIRSLMIKDYKTIPAKIALGSGLIINILLSMYSYNMSQVSATAVIRDIAPKTHIVDVAAIDQNMDSRLSELTRQFDNDYKRLTSEYQGLISKTNDQYKSRQQPYLDRIEYLEKNRKDSNTEWTDREINRQRRKIQPIEAERTQAVNSLESEKQQKLDGLRTKKDTRETAIIASRDTTTNNQLAVAAEHNAEAKAVEDALVFWGSHAAGFAIWVALIAVALLQYFRVRNNILPVYVPGKNVLSMAWEILCALPHKWGTQLLDKARKQYVKAIEIDLPAPYAPVRKWDYTTLELDLLPFPKVEKKGKGFGLVEPEFSGSLKPGVSDIEKKKSSDSGESKISDIDMEKDLSEKKESSDGETSKKSDTKMEKKVSERLNGKPKTEAPKSKKNSNKVSDIEKNGKKLKIKDSEFEILSETLAEDGTVEKVKIGRRWYTRRQCTKKLSDAKRGVENSKTDRAKIKNEKRVEVFEKAIRRFDEGMAEMKLKKA